MSDIISHKIHNPKSKMDETSPALLLIADISGFTKFMRLHALTTSHAHQIIVRLLKVLIDASGPPLKVAELEGDAVFFYALTTEDDLAQAADVVKEQILRFFHVFKQEIDALKQVTACVCEACTNVDQLRLKQVVHRGEVALEQIDRFEKLFGLDVILVHRMLKNTVPSNQYLMMTDPAYAACTDFYNLEPERRTEDFEGVGAVEMLVFYAAALASALEHLPAPPPPHLRSNIGWKLKMHGRTMLELLGLRKKEDAASALFGTP